MNKNDFAALNEHLLEVQPIFADFCNRNGFVFVDRKSLGRYVRSKRSAPKSPSDFILDAENWAIYLKQTGLLWVVLSGEY